METISETVKRNVAVGLMEISFRWSSKWPCPESRRNSVLSSISCVLSPKAKGGEGEISGDLLDQGLGGARGVFDQDMTTDSASDSHKESSLILNKGAPVEQEALSSGEGFGTFLANSIDEAGQKIMHVDEIGNLTNTGNSKLTDTHDEISHDDLTSSANSNQNEGQSSTFQSVDVNLPGSNHASKLHLDREVMKAMEATNALKLIQNKKWLKDRATRLEQGIRNHGRDAFDDAGKLCLALILKNLGILAGQVVVDTAQAGGVCANADGFFLKSRKFFEVKACRAKARRGRVLGPNARPQFAQQNIRFASTWWEKLLPVCRERDPVDWTDVSSYEACGFWIGVASRDECEAALRAKGLPPSKTYSAVVSPWTRDGPPVRHGSWLSPCIEWFQVGKLQRDAAELQRFKAALGLD